MKRFTLILSLMVAMVTTAMAQLEVGKVYQLKSGRDANKVMFNKQNQPGTAAISNSDYSQYFVIEAGTVDGTYAVRDLNYNKYLKPNKQTSKEWTNSDDKTADTDLYISVENEETGAVSIRFSEPSVAGTHNGAHHESWYGNIVSWEATSESSQWTPIDCGTIGEWNAKIEKEEAAYNSAKNNVATILASANYSLVSTEEIALQVEDSNAAGYVWANTYAPGDEGVIDYLIDGKNDTFFHTNWNSYATNGTKDYLEVDLGEGNSVTNLVFDYVTRHNGNTDFPTSVTILGSNDKSEYEEVGTISFGLPVGNTKSYTSPAFGNGKSYRYIRFRVNSTSRGNASIPYFHLAEFNLYKAEVQITDGYEKYVSEVAVADAANKLAEPTTPNEVANVGSILENAVTAYNDANREVALVYNLYYGEKLIETQSVVGLRGEAFPQVVLNKHWVYVKATTPEGVVETAGTHNITLTVEGCPFEFAANYDAVANWYYVKNKGEFYLSHVDDQDYIALGNDQKTVDAGNKDAFSWAFVGNPFDGFQLVNKAAGKGYVLSSSTTIDGDGANTFPVMTATPVAAGSNESWVLTASGYQVNGFFIAQKGYEDNCMNNRDNKLAYWTSGADNGSTFTVELRNDDEELLAALAEAQELVNSITGEGVGYATEASVAAVQAAIDAEDLVALQAAVAAIETIQPTEGAFYYIASAMPSTDARGGQKMYVNNDGAMQFQNAETLGNVFQFVPAGDNTFYLYNVERGTYLNTAKGHAGGQAVADATTGSVKVSIANMGRENAVSIIPNGGAMLHAQAAGSQVVAWNNTDNAGASAWIISEVADITALSHELTVGEAGYATLCLGYNATIPTIEGEDCGVFTAAVADGYAAMTEVEGVLPANTAVIVKAAAGKYEFKYATGEAATIENNELMGTTINANITEDAYVLGIVDDIVGLYTAALNVSTDTSNDGTKEEPNVTYEAWKNNAFKAYLPKPVGATAAYYSFRFENGTTGIEGVEVENEVKAIYDLTGRRVEAITAPGIYIVNGKKVLVK